ncbi:sirohydrochlorin cobaltochelatase [Anaerotruncus colihominis]|uniref:Sirohydrochlorin cobaltochelatase n=1 Tax=Anaerotruncus colihominis TaxID=169435 RepID=A0A845T049_9FIRM|nr:sirohydrochlorin cobaltochelatase [Anaerotruncus colihominis]MCR2024929.1 sirohydrochlorin cobaltochelatase [Anaerotruncus colihominis]NDO40224.1 sirohydrochlorin cobaltochelatase [Anaerotruncus colihominis]
MMETRWLTNSTVIRHRGGSCTAACGLNRKALLAVSFGTSYKKTRDAAIGAIESDLQAAYPDYTVHRAFTSRMILKKLRERDGLQIDTVGEALERLAAEGVGTLVIQPTHVMNGIEYDRMMADAAPYLCRFAAVSFGAPLLNSAADYDAVVRALIAELAPADDTALVLMGHGTEHFADSAYAALDYRFKAMGYPNVFVGTVEGYPMLEHVLAGIRAGGYRKAVLFPLMVVAGDHAANDMAGDEPDSWKNQLLRAGCQVQCVLRGMGEYKSIRALYTAHAGAAIAALASATEPA